MKDKYQIVRFGKDHKAFYADKDSLADMPSALGIEGQLAWALKNLVEASELTPDEIAARCSGVE